MAFHRSSSAGRNLGIGICCCINVVILEDSWRLRDTFDTREDCKITSVWFFWCRCWRWRIRFLSYNISGDFGGIAFGQCRAVQKCHSGADFMFPVISWLPFAPWQERKISTTFAYREVNQETPYSGRTKKRYFRFSPPCTHGKRLVQTIPTPWPEGPDLFWGGGLPGEGYGDRWNLTISIEKRSVRETIRD